MIYDLCFMLGLQKIAAMYICKKIANSFMVHVGKVQIYIQRSS